MTEDTTHVEQIGRRLDDFFDKEDTDHFYRKNKKTGKRTKLYFSPWAAYVRRLNDAVGRNNWESRVDFVEVAGKKLIVVVAVGIRYQEGAPLVWKSNGGTADVTKSDFGTAYESAHSMAFRRASALHGLGLYYYSEEEKEAALRSHREGSEEPDEDPADPDETAAPSEMQQNLIKNICSSSRFTPEERANITRLCRENWNRAYFKAAIERYKAVDAERKRLEERDLRDQYGDEAVDDLPF